MRGFNERLVLHLIRKYGALTKADATIATGLSANAVSVIFNALEAEGCCCGASRSADGSASPRCPMRLNPEARHYHRAEDRPARLRHRGGRFLRHDLCAAQRPAPLSDAGGLLDFVRTNLRPLLRSAKRRREDISAFGVAMPSELWHWTEDFGAPRGEMEAWRHFDVAAELARLVPGTISVENDGTAACRAELVFGPPGIRRRTSSISSSAR